MESTKTTKLKNVVNKATGKAARVTPGSDLQLCHWVRKEGIEQKSPGCPGLQGEVLTRATVVTTARSMHLYL